MKSKRSRTVGSDGRSKRCQIARVAAARVLNAETSTPNTCSPPAMCPSSVPRTSAARVTARLGKTRALGSSNRAGAGRRLTHSLHRRSDETAKALPDELRQKLGQVLMMHRELAELDEKLSTISTQIEMYRERVSELSELSELCEPTQGHSSRRAVAPPGQENGGDLRAAAEGDFGRRQHRRRALTSRVALEDRPAELTLETRREQAVANL